MTERDELPALPAGLRWDLLDPSALDAVEALHQASISGTTADLVKPESRQFLKSLLDGRGRVLGVLRDEELVAYGVLQHDLLPADDPRPQLGLAPTRPVRKLAGAAVARAWRGRGLQRRLIQARIRLAGAVGLLFATAGPANTVSWVNLMRCGFEVRAIEHRYGGYARLLLALEPLAANAATPRADDGSAEELVQALDLARQQALLRAGWHGVEPLPAEASIRYRRGIERRHA